MLAFKKHKLTEDKFAEATRLEALAMRQDLQAALERAGRPIA